MSTIIKIKRKNGTAHRIQYYHQGRRHYQYFSEKIPFPIVKAQQQQIDSALAMDKAGIKPYAPADQSTQPIKLNQFSTWYRAQRNKEQNLATSTIDRYCIAIQTFAQAIGPDTSIEVITSHHIESFKTKQLDSGKTKRGINKNLHHLNHPFKLAAEHNLIPNPPIIKKFKVPRRLPDFLLPEQLDQLAQHLPQGQVRLAFEIMKWSGIRRTELVERCKKKHFDFATNKLTIYGKNNEVLNVPLSLELINYLKSNPIFISRSPEDNIITLNKHSISDGIAVAKQRMGITKRGRTHLLRHSFGIFLLYNGFNVKEVMRMLRHKTIYMTDLYTQAIESILSQKILNLKYQPLTDHSHKSEPHPIDQ